MICLIMMLSGINVFAYESPMKMSWRGDYSDNTDPKLIVEFQTPAKYRQQVTMVIYPASVTNLTSSDYVYIKEITVNAGEKKEIELSILDTYTAADGKYKVALRGNGYMSEESTDSITVDVIKPASIPGLLNEFKSATTANLADVLNKVAPALQLETETDSAREVKRLNIIFNIQTNDYDGEFKNLENIRDSWNLTDVISYMSDADRTAEGIKSRIEANSALLGIDTTTDEYETYIDVVCENIRDYASEYNNGAGVMSAKDVNGILNQYLGLHMVNDATEETLYNTFENYKAYFQLPETELASYNSWGRSERDKALRSLYQKSFTKNAQLVTAFKNGVTGVSNNEGTTPSTPPVVVIPPQGGTSPSNSMSGGAPSAPSAPTQPTVPSFRDVPSSHWAYSYVTKLATNGTIGGYDDGTFKPNNNVTREEFVKMIISATGLKKAGTTCNFGDVPESAWYYEFVASGYESGIIGGIDNATFGVGRNITRQDVAVIAARILTYLEAEIPELTEVTLTDIDTVSDYAQESVNLLNGMGILNGDDDGSFRPNDALTRAEAAAIISRLTAKL